MLRRMDYVRNRFWEIAFGKMLGFGLLYCEEETNVEVKFEI